MCVELPCGYSSQTIAKTVAYSGITIFACLIAVTTLIGLIIESKHDLEDEYSAKTDLSLNESIEEAYSINSTETPTTVDNYPEHKDDLIQSLETQLSDPLTICFVVWLLINIVAGLILSIILLQGAQERNLFKVRTWFFATLVFYLLWIPIYAYWVCHAEDPVNVLMAGFTAYMLGGLCLWVVSAFIEELRIESINHRVGYKDLLVPFYKI